MRLKLGLILCAALAAFCHSLVLTPTSKSLSTTLNTVSFRLLGTLGGRPVLRYRTDYVSEESSPHDTVFYANGTVISEGALPSPFPIHTLNNFVEAQAGVIIYCSKTGSAVQRHVTNSSGIFASKTDLTSSPCRRCAYDGDYIYIWTDGNTESLSRFFLTGTGQQTMPLTMPNNVADVTVFSSLFFVSASELRNSSASATPYITAEVNVFTTTNTQVDTIIMPSNTTSMQVLGGKLCMFNEYVQTEFSVTCYLLS